MQWREANSVWRTLAALPTNVARSIFRNPLPSSDRGRAATSFTNFFLHLQPVKVSRRSLRPTTTLALGLISLFLFFILTFTGVLLMFYYVPSTAQAYARMLDLRGVVSFGGLLRNAHRWAAHAMVAVVFLHMCRVFFTGAYKPPREFNWVIGVALFMLTLFFSFTGYLLPWDQLAFWAITVGTSIAGYVPVVGKQLQFLLLGDSSVGQEALLRFYVLHVAVLPILASLLLAVHFWRIRKDGGLARPEEAAGEIPEDQPARFTLQLEATPSAPAQVSARGLATEVRVRNFNIQGFVPHPAMPVETEDTVFSWPQLLNAELLMFVLTLVGVAVVSFFFRAPLEGPANTIHPPNPAKAPWYFLGLQEMVSHSAFWGGVGVPAIEILLLLFLPYMDRKPVGVGRWFARERRLANSLFAFFALANLVLIVIGTFFRGANWAFVWPF